MENEHSFCRDLSTTLVLMLIEAAESGGAYRRADAERRILALIETLLAAKDAAPPERIKPAAPQPYESARAGRVAP